MNTKLLQQLRAWRDDTAKRERVDGFRVLPNATLMAIAETEPKVKGDLMTIKGIKDRKFAKYGESILGIVARCTTSSTEVSDLEESRDDQLFCVGAFLDRINSVFGSMSARIKGEISGVQYRGKAVYFTIRDGSGEASMSCFAWAQEISVFGVELTEGMEVIISGSPNVYKPYGKLSFHVNTVEPVGEGALKVAYDRLVAKLEAEGMFDPDRKQSLSTFPQTIGIITSRDGAVIHDFLNNVGKNGFRFLFRDVRVEGQSAVTDVLSAITAFRTVKLDALVIMRGGGSLESLQAFNNEAIVRAVSELPFPVIVAIGHHQDMPIVSLVADIAVSTPTAAAQVLNAQWDILRQRERDARRRLGFSIREMVSQTNQKIATFRSVMAEGVSQMFRSVLHLERRFFVVLSKYESRIHSVSSFFDIVPKELEWANRRIIQKRKEILSALERALQSYDPERRLRLGYALVRDEHGRIVNTVAQGQKSAILTISVADGVFTVRPIVDNNISYGKTTSR